MRRKVSTFLFFCIIIKTNLLGGGFIVKMNLPVLLLRGIVLLPNNDLRLEFDLEMSKNILDVSELFHDNHVLVVSQLDPLEESLDINTLPKIGVIASISHKMVLPNGNTRAIVTGIKRANINEYLNLNHSEMLESIVIEQEPIVEIDQEEIYLKKLYREMENYIKTLPYMSNSVLSLINDCKDLSKMTDVIVPNLNINLNRMREYLEESSPLIRTEMILKDIYQEQEMFQLEKTIDAKVRNEMDRSQKEYFLHEKLKILKEELGESTLKEDEIEKIKARISSNIPISVKEKLEKEIKRYEQMNASSVEIDTTLHYIESLLDLPWGIVTEDSFSFSEIKKALDDSHSGLEEIKKRVLEYLALKKVSEENKSPILCLVGPPGVGKTSFAFSLAQALHRNFVKISVGGLHDEAEIKGHRRSYIGSSYGQIIDGMKKAKSMNPVFLIDEIDKMVKNYQGDPASSLLEVLDPEQNKYFKDHYLEEEFDLSNVFFITTANTIEDIPVALKDRLEVISLTGYTEYEKVEIAKNHFIPDLLKSIKKEYDIQFNDDALLKIIRNYTKESGVRELKRKIEAIIREIIYQNLEENQAEDIIVDRKTVKKYLGNPIFDFLSSSKEEQVGVVNGLAYTNYGGDTLPVEVILFKGSGKLLLTGSLGEVMKESAQLSLSYLKANYKKYQISYERFTQYDIHIHIPEGAIPKEGPSAGITITTALLSALTNKKVKQDFSMTGEMTLNGTILPIGGLKEKSIGALRHGIKKVIIPYGNKKDFENLPEEIKKQINYVFVKDYYEVYKEVFYARNRTNAS